MRIFGWRADPGTAYWRLAVPLVELASRGHDCMVADLAPDCVTRDAEADVFVASRTAMPGPSQTFRQLCREGRMLMVYDLDDDFWSVEPHNRAAFELFSRPDIQSNIETNLSMADLVTVSTETLAEVVSAHTSAPVRVLPNRMPRWATELLMPDAYGGPVRYGHTGGASHLRDFGEIAKTLRAFFQHRAGSAEFVAVGQDSTARVASIRGRTRYVPWQLDVRDYLHAVSTSLDVGLAPLRDTVFNRSKTGLKAMEYGALGLPVIASNVEPYTSYVRHGETGFLCASPREWREALDALMDADLRRRMGLAGRAQARQHLIEDHAHEWLRVYEGVRSWAAASVL